MSTPTPERRAAILARLREPVPLRPAPPPRARNTWKGLRKGSQLRSASQIVEVEEVFSDGVVVRTTFPFRSILRTRLTTLEGWDPIDPPKARRKGATPRPRRKKGAAVEHAEPPQTPQQSGGPTS